MAKPLSKQVAALAPQPGDVLLVRADDAPPVPAGVQVILVPPGDVVKLTTRDLGDAGWVRRKA